MTERIRGPRRKFWVFTINNPEKWEPWTDLPSGVNFITWQVERGKNMTIHLQGYLELEKSQYLTWLRANIDNRGHFEVRRGTQTEAITYCHKADTRQLDGGPFSLGRMSHGAGERLDIVAYRDAIWEGKTAKDLWMSFPRCMAKYPRMYASLKSTMMPKRTHELTVTLIYGKTGRGKTRLVYKNWMGNPGFWRWPCPNTAAWFDGYDGHTHCLLDDFGGKISKMNLVMFLQVADRYPLLLPIKGSYVWWMPTYLAITTNIHPRDWYNYDRREEQYKALKRRIHEVLVFDVKKEDGGYEASTAGDDFWYDPVLYPRPPTIDLRCDESFEEEDLRSDEIPLGTPDTIPLDQEPTPEDWVEHIGDTDWLTADDVDFVQRCCDEKPRKWYKGSK